RRGNEQMASRQNIVDIPKISHSAAGKNCFIVYNVLRSNDLSVWHALCRVSGISRRTARRDTQTL
ncbi:hypothetical protein, partial [Erythrobacter donghaensis]|uniref:hypothetical protein n=1 Tax=Erythrobacter donghaensis TaxID=267135 RepID=UPI001E28DFF0